MTDVPPPTSIYGVAEVEGRIDSLTSVQHLSFRAT